MSEADGRNAVAPKRWLWRPPPVAGGPARRGRSSISRRDGGERCGRRDGGAAPGRQRDVVHIESGGQRRRVEALVIATTSLWRAGMRGEAVERWGRRDGDGVAAVGLVGIK